MFDARKYILSQFDEEQTLTDKEKISINVGELYSHHEYGAQMENKLELLKVRQKNGYSITHERTYLEDTDPESEMEPEIDDLDTSYCERT